MADGSGNAAVAVASDARLGRCVAKYGVDLPGSPIWVTDPDLVLDRETAGRVFLNGGLETCVIQADGGRRHLARSLDFDAQMVERAEVPMTSSSTILNQDELEGGVENDKVGVSRLAALPARCQRVRNRT